MQSNTFSSTILRLLLMCESYSIVLDVRNCRYWIFFQRKATRSGWMPKLVVCNSWIYIINGPGWYTEFETSFRFVVFINIMRAVYAASERWPKPNTNLFQSNIMRIYVSPNMFGRACDFIHFHVNPLQFLSNLGSVACAVDFTKLM